MLVSPAFSEQKETPLQSLFLPFMENPGVSVSRSRVTTQQKRTISSTIFVPKTESSSVLLHVVAFRFIASERGEGVL
jgi:hypothetical protein